MAESIFTVIELTRRVKALVESDEVLQSLYVRGEVSNYVLSSAGHAYFTLKDSQSQVRCALFRNNIRARSYLPKSGEAVVVHGRVGVYEPSGAYQLIADLVQPEGVGLLQLKFEQLRAKLEREGLFDEARKRPLPSCPHRIGVVTSPTGAVIRDIINVTRRRFPLVELVVSPTLVQGDGAPESICRAIQAANDVPDLDLLIVARGGGSLEDLWPFNDERVARAIFASRLPVVSAVGHETDFTIADFVADLRAPTPSAAAELVVPDVRSYRLAIDQLADRLEGAVLDSLAERRRAVDEAEVALARHSPLREIERWRQAVDELSVDLTSRATSRLGMLRERLRGRALQLSALSPLAVLGRGYSLTTHLSTGRVIRSVAAATPGELIDVRVADGAFRSRVE